MTMPFTQDSATQQHLLHNNIKIKRRNRVRVPAPFTQDSATQQLLLHNNIQIKKRSCWV